MRTYKRKPLTLPLTLPQCANCHAPFTPTHWRKRFCTPRCKYNFHASQYRQRNHLTINARRRAKAAATRPYGPRPSTLHSLNPNRSGAITMDPLIIRHYISTLSDNRPTLTKWESSFIDSLQESLDNGKSLTDRQCSILESIYSTKG